MKLPTYYCYPAILTYDEGHEIAVTFPDLPGCTTSGKTEEEALQMAQEAMGGHLWCMEEDGDPIPEPTRLKDVVLAKNETSTLVSVYMPAVRLSEINRSVNRTVTLPAWLNAAAVAKGINFSQLLQESIKKIL